MALPARAALGATLPTQWGPGMGCSGMHWSLLSAGLSMAGHGWPLGKEPDRAGEQGHKGQGMGTEQRDVEMGRGTHTEHRDTEMEQKSDRDEKGCGDWAEPER